jgi:hypothetical protein
LISPPVLEEDIHKGWSTEMTFFSGLDFSCFPFFCGAVCAFPFTFIGTSSVLGGGGGVVFFPWRRQDVTPTTASDATPARKRKEGSVKRSGLLSMFVIASEAMPISYKMLECNIVVVLFIMR